MLQDVTHRFVIYRIQILVILNGKEELKAAKNKSSSRNTKACTTYSLASKPV